MMALITRLRADARLSCASVVAIPEAALPAKGDGMGQGVQAFLFLQPDQHAAAELHIVEIAQDVACFRQTPQLLDRSLQRVLPLERLQLGDDQRRPYQPIPERSGHPIDIVPVPYDQLGLERLAEHRVERAILGTLVGPELGSVSPAAK